MMICLKRLWCFGLSELDKNKQFLDILDLKPWKLIDNSHLLGADQMKDIANFAKSSLDINKPMLLYGI